VDASGFAFWLAESSGIEGLFGTAGASLGGESSGGAPPAAPRLRADLGGCYGAFDALVRGHVAALAGGCGLHLHFVLDGPSRPSLKHETGDKRREQRREQWAALHGWCLDGLVDARPASGDSRFPAPPLLMTQFRASLAAAAAEATAAAAVQGGSPGGDTLPRRGRVAVETSAGEADAEIARLCAAHNAAGGRKRFFVLADDSDFLVYRGCRYINFNGLELKPLHAPPPPASWEIALAAWGGDEAASAGAAAAGAAAEAAVEGPATPTHSVFAARVWDSELLAEVLFLGDRDYNSEEEGEMDGGGGATAAMAAANFREEGSGGGGLVRPRWCHGRLVELAALLGNDYTAHFPTSAWVMVQDREGLAASATETETATRTAAAAKATEVSNAPGSAELRDVAAAVAWLSAAPRAACLQAAVPRAGPTRASLACAAALRYTKALYGLDLAAADALDGAHASWQGGAAASGGRSEKDGEDGDCSAGGSASSLRVEDYGGPTVRLLTALGGDVPSADDWADRRWAEFCGGCERDRAAMEPATLATLATWVTFAVEALNAAVRSEDVDSGSDDKETSAPGPDEGSISDPVCVDLVQAEAFYSAINRTLTGQGAPDNDGLRPEWRDVVALQSVQVCLSQMMKIFDASQGLRGLVPEPRCLIDGALFHSEVQRLRAQGRTLDRFDRREAAKERRSLTDAEVPVADSATTHAAAHAAAPVAPTVELVLLVEQIGCAGLGPHLGAFGVGTVAALASCTEEQLVFAGIKMGARLKIRKWQEALARARARGTEAAAATPKTMTAAAVPTASPVAAAAPPKSLASPQPVDVLGGVKLTPADAAVLFGRPPQDFRLDTACGAPRGDGAAAESAAGGGATAAALASDAEVLAQDMPSSSVYVKNLDPATTDEELKSVFSYFLKAADRDKFLITANYAKGVAFVNLGSQEAVARAVSESRGAGIFVGDERLVVEPKKPRGYVVPSGLGAATAPSALVPAVSGLFASPAQSLPRASAPGARAGPAAAGGGGGAPLASPLAFAEGLSRMALEYLSSQAGVAAKAPTPTPKPKAIAAAQPVQAASELAQTQPKAKVKAKAKAKAGKVTAAAALNGDSADDRPRAVASGPDVLPIDAHADRIIAYVASHRVTIIHGETGCGKSSTVPIMLLKAHDAARARGTAAVGGGGKAPLKASPGPAKMFVTQPRRIAARSLCARVRSTLDAEKAAQLQSGGGGPWHPGGGLVGLRLGHGEKDEDEASTRVWFATTGYVVLLLAHHPETFMQHSHLIIDGAIMSWCPWLLPRRSVPMPLAMVCCPWRDVIHLVF